MKRLVNFVALTAGMLGSAAAVAAEQTARLAVGNMYCSACPSTVKKALTAVPGVTKADVSYKVVTFDDARASIESIAAASTNAGYPAKLAQQAK